MAKLRLEIENRSQIPPETADSGRHSVGFDKKSQCDELSQQPVGLSRAKVNFQRFSKEDFEGGYIFNVELRVSGEVFGDFVVLAKKAIDEGHKDVAAVLACAALEDALKRYAKVNGLSTDDKTMADIVNALKGAGLVAGAQKALLDRMPTIRNYALHANWDKISQPDVGSVIGFVEQFLLTRFSN